MRALVIVTLQVEGFHQWPQACDPVEFLATNHRHLFHIRGEFPVTHGDRELEIIQVKRWVVETISHYFGTPARFDSMSCEHICEWLLEKFPAASAFEVLEDGENGGRVER